FESGEYVFFGGQFPDPGGSDVSADFDSGSGGCGNITCHGGTGGVDWYAESTGCADCHGDENDLDNPVNPFATAGEGSGGKHVTHASAERIACEGCHLGYKDQTTHMNTVYGRGEPGSILGFGGVFLVGGDVTADFDDSSGNGTCSDVSCHGGTGAGGAWFFDATGDGDDIQCAECHGGTDIDPFASGGSGTDGKHTVHAADRGIDCEVCHLDYRGSGNHMNAIYGSAETDTILFFGGSFPVGGDVTADFDDDGGGCSDVSCHGGAGSGGDWRAATTPCMDCHEGDGIDPFVTAKGAGASGAAGQHTRHVSDKGIPCLTCHGDYPKNPNHIDGIYGDEETASILDFGGTYASVAGDDVSADFDDAGAAGACSDISCHGGAGSGGDWYTAGGSIACMDCHKGDLIDPFAIGGS
ncbi:MAG: hypothetical protein GY867_04460, partial [bacterium]|nr:hypothetical protein [bacterium]